MDATGSDAPTLEQSLSVFYLMALQKHTLGLLSMGLVSFLVVEVALTLWTLSLTGGSLLLYLQSRCSGGGGNDATLVTLASKGESAQYTVTRGMVQGLKRHVSSVTVATAVFFLVGTRMGNEFMLSFGMEMGEASVSGAGPLLADFGQANGRHVGVIRTLLEWVGLLWVVGASGAAFMGSRLTHLAQGMLCVFLAALLFPCAYQMWRIFSLGPSDYPLNVTPNAWFFVDDGGLWCLGLLPGVIGVVTSVLLGPRVGWVKTDKQGQAHCFEFLASSSGGESHKSSTPSCSFNRRTERPVYSPPVGPTPNTHHLDDRQHLTLGVSLTLRVLGCLMFNLFTMLYTCSMQMLQHTQRAHLAFQRVPLAQVTPDAWGFNEDVFASCLAVTVVTWSGFAASWVLDYAIALRRQIVLEGTRPQWMETLRPGSCCAYGNERVSSIAPYRSLHPWSCSKLTQHLESLSACALASLSVSRLLFNLHYSLLGVCLLSLPIPPLLLLFKSLLRSLRVDDPIGLLAICISGAVWGLIVPSLLIPLQSSLSKDMIVQSVLLLLNTLFNQAVFMVALVIISGSTTAVLIYALKYFGLLRLAEKEEVDAIWN
jgi:hypothetical protein